MTEPVTLTLSPSEYVIRVVQTESNNWDEIRTKMGWENEALTDSESHFNYWPVLYPNEKHPTTNTRYIRTLHALFGLCTETGELMDIIKRYTFYGAKVPTLDEVNIAEEIGDMLWYIGLLCDEYKWTFEQLMGWNIRKLQDKKAGRYKKGEFCAIDAIVRDTVAEQSMINQEFTVKTDKHGMLPSPESLRPQSEQVMYAAGKKAAEVIEEQCLTTFDNDSEVAFSEAFYRDARTVFCTYHKTLWSKQNPTHPPKLEDFYDKWDRLPVAQKDAWAEAMVAAQPDELRKVSK